MKRGIALFATVLMLLSTLIPSIGTAYTELNGNANLGRNVSENQLLPDRSQSEELTTQYDPNSVLSASDTERVGSVNQEELLLEAAKDYDDDDIVNAIIVLDGAPLIQSIPVDELTSLAAAQKRNSILNEQERVLGVMREKLNSSEFEVVYSYTVVTNGLAIKTRFANLAKIAKVKGVSYVYVSPQYTLEPDTVSAGDMIGAGSVWKSGFTGKGIKVGIIDTGIDTSHPSFADDPADPSMTRDDLTSELISLLHASGEAMRLYRSPKIPFGYNYCDNNLNIGHDIDSASDHGTHVAGIAAANVVEGADAVGVAPDAQLLVFKVFGVNGGAYTTDIIAAMEDAVLLGVNVINLSLGSPAGFTNDDPEMEAIMERMEQLDVFVAISAGNNYSMGYDNAWGLGLNLGSNPDNGIVGSPGTFNGATTVASIENALYESMYFEVDGLKIGFADSAASDYTIFYTAMGSGNSYGIAPVEGYGDTVEAFIQANVEGKIAMVSRGGGVAFTVKQANAKAAGAVACIVYNNVSGTFGMIINDGRGNIPCVSIAREDAETIFEKLADGIDTLTVGTGKAMVDNPIGYSVSEYSSIGVTPDLKLKPEISGVGGNVYSTLNGGTYGVMSGTSMASPQIAGAAALVMECLRERDDVQFDSVSLREYVNALLMCTAVPMTVNGVPVSPRSQGAGLVNVEFAVNAGAYVSVAGNAKPKLELGDDPEKLGVYTMEFNIVNITDSYLGYYANVSVLTEKPLYASIEGYESPLCFMSGEAMALGDAQIELSYAHDGYYMGDADGDGSVSVSDSLLTLRHSLSMSAEITNATAADYNLDGQITIEDALLIMRSTMFGYENMYVEPNELIVAAGASAAVVITVRLSSDEKAFIDENYPNGMYIDGFVCMQSSTDDVNLTIPYLAFYGDWAQAPAMDEYDWGQYINGDTADYSQYPNIAWTTGSYGYLSFFLGENYYDTDRTIDYLADRNALSPNGDGWRDALTDVYVSLLRNARNLSLTVTDAGTGEVYRSLSYDYIRKSAYSSSYGQVIPTVFSWLTSGEAVWKGTNAAGTALADQTKVIVTIEAQLDYDEDQPANEFSTWSFPITIDASAPRVRTSQRDSDGRKYLDVTIIDNQYVMSLLIYSEDGRTEYDRVLFGETEPGVQCDYSVDITDFGTNFQVIAEDYAGNTTNVRVQVEQEEVPATGIQLSEDFLPVFLWGEAKTLTATYTPNGLAAEDVTFTGDDDNVATISADGVVTPVAAGRMTVTGVSSDGQFTDQCIVQVIQSNGMLQAFKSNGSWIAFDGLYLQYTMDAGAVDFQAYAAELVGEEVYGYTSQMQFFQLNLWSGGTPTVYPSTFNQQNYQVTDMTYDYTTQTMFAIASIGATRYLMVSNISTGALTPIAPITGAPDTVITLACDRNGQLYGVTIGDSTLCAIDKYTAVATPIGRTGMSSNYVQSMTFDLDNNVLYWAQHNFLDANLTIIDVETGKACSLGRISDGSELVGLTCSSFDPPAAAETEDISGILISESSIVMAAGGIKMIDAVTLPYNAEDKSIVWSCDDEGVAGILEDGTVLGFWFGTATITATTADGRFSASCTVNVMDGEAQIYGQCSVDYNNENEGKWVSFSPFSPSNVTGLGKVNQELLNCAEYVNGKIYGYDMFNRYVIQEFGTWIPVYTGATSAGTMALDMTFDYSTSTMYALIDTEYLYIVDVDSGAMSYAVTLDCAPIYCIAATTEGQIYGLSYGYDGSSTKLYRIDKATGESTLVGDTGAYMSSSLQSMAYDHANGVMYWAQCYYTQGRLMQVNLENGMAAALGTIGGNCQICGLFAPYDEVISNEPVTSISFNHTELPMLVGDTETLTVSFKPFNAQNKNLTWHSSDSSVVGVDENGTLTAYAEGEVTITATSEDGGKTAACVVTSREETGLMYGFRAYSRSGYYGDWLRFLSGNGNSWTSVTEREATYVASADYYDGFIYGFETADDGIYRGFKESHETHIRTYTGVEITDVPVDMSFDYSVGAMYVLIASGTERALYIMLLDTGELIWYCNIYGAEQLMALAVTTEGDMYGITSGNEKLGTSLLYSIDKNTGVCTFIGNTGKNANYLQSMAYDHNAGVMYWAQYFADADGGLYEVNLSTGRLTARGCTGDMAEITGMYSVLEDIPTPTVAPISGVILSKEQAFLFAGQTQQLNVTVMPINAADKSVTWSSSDESIATVDENGLVTALGRGIVYITATSADPNYSTSCEFKCNLYPDRFMAYAAELGGFVSFTADTLPQTQSAVAWSGRGAAAVEYANGYIYIVTIIERALYRIDSEGNAELIGNAGYVYDMAYDVTTDTMYALGNIDGLCIMTIDLETAQTTRLYAAGLVSALTITDDGLGYVISRSAEIYTMNMATGEKTYVGKTGLKAFTYTQTLAYDNVNEVLYLGYLYNADESYLAAIDVRNGQAYFVGNIGRSGLQIVGLMCIFDNE